tara:strand:+ start:58130 stop:58345 length:216 start_codon:yes stop_codon:yes gene_type:complete
MINWACETIFTVSQSSYNYFHPHPAGISFRRVLSVGRTVDYSLKMNNRSEFSICVFNHPRVKWRQILLVLP